MACRRYLPKNQFRPARDPALPGRQPEDTSNPDTFGPPRKDLGGRSLIFWLRWLFARRDLLVCSCC